MNRIATVVLMVCLMAPAGFAKKPLAGPDEAAAPDPGKGLNFYSIEKEIELGKQMAEDVERQATLLYDPVINEYVNRLGQNLARNSSAKTPFTIKVIDSDEINAFALPGGFMFVNTGLILKTGGEAELAGVMSHEIAHVAARHGTKQATRGAISDYATIPLIFISGWAGYAIRQAADLAIPLGFLRFSRGMEQQADHLGMEYLTKAGYDPTAFVDFFEKIGSLEKKKLGIFSKLFATHPMTSSRIARAQKEIQNDLKPLPEYVVDTSEFHQVQERLARLQNRRQIESRNNPVMTLKRRTPAPVEPDSDSQAGQNNRPTLKGQN